MSDLIRHYEHGDAPTVRKAYLQGVILQDGSFNSNGLCLFINDEGGIDQSCSREHLYVDPTDDITA